LKVWDEKLAKEYLDEKNTVRIEEVVPGSHEKRWWRCSNPIQRSGNRQCGHVWEAQVKARALNGVGCPKCNESKGEAAVNNVLKELVEQGTVTELKREHTVRAITELLIALPGVVCGRQKKIFSGTDSVFLRGRECRYNAKIWKYLRKLGLSDATSLLSLAGGSA
jgi:hypothetical protein